MKNPMIKYFKIVFHFLISDEVINFTMMLIFDFERSKEAIDFIFMFIFQFLFL